MKNKVSSMKFKKFKTIMSVTATIITNVLFICTNKQWYELIILKIKFDMSTKKLFSILKTTIKYF